jgi:ElaB/YqjD/DUF883 family membrane-anchored ribosome-binding protein
MNRQYRLRIGFAALLLMLAGCICASLRAQASAPEPETTTFAKGPLPPHVAEQVRAIVTAQVKAFLPPSEAGAVEIDRLDKDTILIATVNGQRYSGKVFRTFLVQPLDPDPFEAMAAFYVRTTAPWPLKSGLVIPADIYLSGMAEQVNAFDADAIAAQDAAIAQSELLCKRALAQLEPEQKAKAAAVAAEHKDEMDSLTKRIKQLQDEVDKKLKAREQETNSITQRQPLPTTPVISRGPNNTILWQWAPRQGFTFNDGLDESRQKLDAAASEQKALQRTMDAELEASAGQAGGRARAIRAVLQKHSKSIRGGEIITQEDMRADYEAALGEALNETPASAKPESPKLPDGKPAIQAVPAQKRGT